jgi:hypothetical protein
MVLKYQIQMDDYTMIFSFNDFSFSY